MEPVLLPGRSRRDRRAMPGEDDAGSSESPVRGAEASVDRHRGAGHSRWVSQLLSELGHEVIVANARELRAITGSDRKSDRVDAEKLAQYARVDRRILRPLRHRGEEAQVDMLVLRGRAVLVKTRTQIVNSVRGMVKSFGYRMPTCSTEKFAQLKVLVP